MSSLTNDDDDVDDEVGVRVEMINRSMPTSNMNDSSSDSSSSSGGSTTHNNDGHMTYHSKKSTWIMKIMIGTTFVFALIAMILGGHAIAIVRSYVPSTSMDRLNRHVQRIAFGSCIAYDYRPQKIWKSGVMNSGLDAWIWAGDSVYMDLPTMSCAAHPSACQCTKTFIRKNNCGEGDMSNALERVRGMMQHEDYRAFVQWMCPNSETVPPTDMEAQCTRWFHGTWDDHDFGWNNGNRRLPDKDRYKQLFLDLMGVSPMSARRNRGSGIEHHYTYNEQTPDERIDVFLLDERYERPPLPCFIRRDWCEKHVLATPSHHDYEWCYDFVHGMGGNGSCCAWDDRVAREWCPSHKNDPLWEEACDATSSNFGRRALEFNANHQLVPVADRGDVYLSKDDTIQDPPFCDVLGRRQRSWFQRELEKAKKARLKIIVSGSVVTHDPRVRPCPDYPSATCQCGTDDFDCYPQAQVNLLHTLQRATADGSCVVVLTGDYHISDIKVIEPGTDNLYHTYYKSENWKYPIYQLMSSGMTRSTAKYQTCPGGWADDPLGLRYGGRCNFFNNKPSFGMIQVDWHLDDPIVHLQLRTEDNVVEIEKTFKLSTCT